LDRNILEENLDRIINGNSDTWVGVGTRLSVRRYGTTQHFQVRSETPGTDGDMVVNQDEVEELGTLLVALGKIVHQKEKLLEDVAIDEVKKE